MSNTNKDGGPAFPCEWNPLKVDSPDLSSAQCRGMSLRDWFAGMALQGIKSNPELCRICAAGAEGYDDQGHRNTQQEMIAKMAYVDADAMLKERLK